MPEKVEILVELKNDRDVLNRLKEIQHICDDLKKGVTVRIDSTELVRTSKQTADLGKALTEVERKRSAHVESSSVEKTTDAAINAARALQELERTHTININADQLLNLPSALDRNVQGWLQSVGGIGKMLPSVVTNAYTGFTMDSVLGAGKDYADVTWFGKGGKQLPSTITYTDRFERIANFMSMFSDGVKELNRQDAAYAEFLKQQDAAYAEFKETFSDPAFTDMRIPKKYWESYTDGVKEAKGEVISLQQVLTGLGGGLNTIGGALTSVGNLFHMDLFGTVERTLTAYGTILATQGFRNAISRYDIMTTYADYMEIMGVSAEKADESLERVNQAIQGIPVGLDTAAQEIRMFTMYLQGTGDSMDEVADKATNLTIGLERALVAGGASEAMKTTAKYEMNRLLATGSLTTARQWQALLNGLGVSGQYLKDVMGYGDISTQEFISKLGGKDPEISTDQFIEGVAALADYEGLNKAIDIYKTTIEAGMYDIRFAVTRGFANTFQVINDMLEQETGEGIRDYMQDIRGGINDLFKDIQGWIQAHPEVITLFFDKLNEVMARAKELNVGKVMEDIATQGGKMIDFFLKIYDAIPPGAWRQLFVFSTTWAGPLGRMFNLAGTVLTLLGKFAGVLGKLPLIGKLFSMFSIFAPSGGTVISGVGGFKTIFGSLGAVLGMEGVIAAAGGVIYEFAKIGESLAGMDLDGYTENLKKLLPFIGAVSGVMAVLVGVVGGTSVATGGVVALAAAIGEAVALGFLAELDYAVMIIGSLANVAQTIADLDLPSDFSSKVSRFGSGVASIFKMLPTITDTDVMDSGNLKAFFDNMNEAIGAMDGAAETLGNIEGKLNWLNRSEGKFEEIKTKVSNFAKGIGDVYQAFIDGFGPAGPAKRASDKYADTLANMNSAMTELSSLTTAMSEMEYLLDTLQLGISGKTEMVETEVTQRVGRSSRSNETKTLTSEEWAPDNFQKYVTRITEFVEGIDSILEVLGSSVAASLGEKWETSLQANALKAMNDALTHLSTLSTTVGTFKDEFDYDTMSRGITNLVQFTEALFPLFSTDAFQNFEQMAGAPQLAQNFQNIALAFGGEDGRGGIVAVVTALRNSIAPITAIENEDAVTRIGTILDGVKAAVDEFGEDDGSEFLTKATNVKDAIDNVKQIIDSMSTINESIGSLFGEDTNVGAKIGELMSSMFSSFDTENAESFSTRIGEMQTMIQSVVDLYAALAETDLSGLNEQLQLYIDKLANQAIPLTNTFKDSLGSARSEAGMLAANLQSIGVMASMANGYIPALQGGLTNLTGSLTVATTAASGLVAALSAIQSVNVNASVNTGSVNNATGRARRIHGRQLYMATGGPVGTDTIPAWLSPGEFIMRAKAVRTFGEAFMQNVNHLNIAGAINSLAKQYAFNTPNAASYVNNYDNHASVTQNIITNNADYSYKRASRFVRALH